jgi:hypothetical protein
MRMFSTPNRIPFESHLERLQEPARTIMLDLRSFVKSLGTNVIEEVRPHRVVYAKTMNFRTFLDVEPAGDSLVLSVRYGRAAPPVTATVRTAQDAENAKKQIAEAYSRIQ